MTEDEARERVRADVSAEAFARLERLAIMVIAENERQNLVSRTTIEAIWARHILDSVQLIRWAGEVDGPWLDIGTGGGFPGLAIAAASPWSMLLVEPRRRRADFLRGAVDDLGLRSVDVAQARVEAIQPMQAAIISARAVAPIEKLLRDALHCTGDTTRWILPRGKSYEDEMHRLGSRWRGLFHVEQSLTDADAGIVVVTGAMPR